MSHRLGALFGREVVPIGPAITRLELGHDCPPANRERGFFRLLAADVLFALGLLLVIVVASDDERSFRVKLPKGFSDGPQVV